METLRESYHLKDTIRQQDASMAFSKGRLNSLVVFWHLVERPRNTWSTLLVSSILFERFYLIAPRKIVRKSLMIY